jgi:tRNA modification GTPase
MPFSTSDTIVAIATPPGRGGIGVVRLSGPDAQTISRRLITHRKSLTPRLATFTKVRCDGAGALDHVVVTYFPAPASYTGDDVVELSAHGSPVVLRAIVSAAMQGGARLAEPGEFTLRRFLSGRIDLLQAEAVADLIDAATPRQARAAFDQLEGTLTTAIAEIDAALFDLMARLEASVDFPEEGYRFVEPEALAREIDALISRTSGLLEHASQGRLIREGLEIAIVGRPNVGKSSLFNALVGCSRAIVTEVEGTTRDLVSEAIDLDGLRVTLVDTAGLRDTNDRVEAEGVTRSKQAVTVADLVLVVVDQTSTDSEILSIDGVAELAESKRLVVANKSDLPATWPERLKSEARAIFVSAKTGAGLDTLRQKILEALGVDALIDRDRPQMTNIRHIELVERARESLIGARTAALSADGSMSEEFVLADLQGARSALEEVSGRRAPEDLLEHIFSRFCIGK